MQESLSEGTRETSKEVSIYGQGKVSTKTFAECIIRIKKAFPDLPDGWYDILEELLDAEKFTDKRFIDAAKNLIINCQYPKPTIANILSYDKKMQLYTYDELIKLTTDLSNESRRLFLQKYEIKDNIRKLWGRI